MLDILKKTNRNRKLTPSEKNKLQDVLIEAGKAQRGRTYRDAEVKSKSAQKRYEESIGADKIQNQIKQKCAEINELQVQLIESACDVVNTEDRITRRYRGERHPEETVKLKGEKLKKYKAHKKLLDSLEAQVNEDYDHYIKIQTILGVEKVGEAIELIESLSPTLLNTSPSIAIETEAA